MRPGFDSRPMHVGHMPCGQARLGCVHVGLDAITVMTPDRPRTGVWRWPLMNRLQSGNISIGGLVVEYIVAIDVTRARFPADALSIDALANSVMMHWCQHNLMAQELN